MKKTIVFAVILFLTGIAYAGEFEVKEKAGGYQVEFKIDNVRVGANKVKIEITDESGEYVTDAEVHVEYSMPEGIDLPPMNFKTDIKPKGHEYLGTIKIPMAGTWTTVVNVIRGGKASSTKFDLEVH